MTVDVEDYFHACPLHDTWPRASWSGLPSRIERNIDIVLALLDQHQVHATFFILGWVARRYPRVVASIAAAGHEVASHGDLHYSAALQTRPQFRRDVIRSKALLEDIAGRPVIGYRAPGFSVGHEHRWALDTLFQAGYRYSSSSYPRGRSGAPRFACFPAGASGILELPVSTMRVCARNLGAGGGAAFRVMPYALSRAMLRRLATHDGQPCVFHFNTWEIDHGQPRARLTLRARLRQYAGLGGAEARLLALTRDFAWGRIDEVFPMLPADPDVSLPSQPRPRWHSGTSANAALNTLRSRS